MKRLVLTAALLVAAAPAHAEDAALVAAVLVPNGPVASVGDKARVVAEVGAALERALGVRVTARAYANAEDLERDGAEVAFAITDASFAASRGWVRPFASAVVGGRDRGRLALFVGPAIPGAWALEGKRVALPRLGRATAGVLDGLLLEGELPPGRVTRVVVPDAASALQSVRLGKADALVLSEATAARLGVPSLRPILTSRELPLYALCTAGQPLPAEVLTRLRERLDRIIVPTLGIDGFRAAPQDVWDGLRRDLAGGPRRLPPPHVPAPTFRGPALLAPPVAVPVPNLREYLTPLR